MTFIETLHRRRFLGIVLAGLLCNGLPARAEPPGRVMFGFVLTPAAEGLMTAVLHDLQGRYRPDLGTKLVYLPGNSGALAMQAVANAPPDGATALLTSSGAMTLLPIMNALPIDPATALQPVAGIGEFVYGFVVGPAVPAHVRTMRDYLSWAQANPGLAAYGLPGIGTAPHFVGTEIARLSGISLRAVGYKGLLPVMRDVVNGSIPAALTVLPGGADLVAFPDVRVLAVTSSQRWPGHPDTPTLMELGLADSPTVDSLGFFMPAGTPSGKIDELREAVRLALQSRDTIASMQENGVVPMPLDVSYPDQILRERTEWRKRVDRRHFEPDR